MNKTKIKAAITFLAIMLSFTVFAQGPGGRGGRQGGGEQRSGKPDASEILNKLDTNNDDKIDKDEASNDRRGKISKDFDNIDANADGFIDLEELEVSLDGKKPKKVSAAKVLKEVDDNEDGLLNELEVAAKDKRDLMDNFSTIDTNDDSQLDLEELKVFYSKDGNRKKKRTKKD